MTTESFIQNAKTLIETWVEYEESHQDAGDNYSHLASEGNFDYYNGESRLQEYCDETGIDISCIDIDRLAEGVIFWGYMAKGESYDPHKRFLVASYQVGEIGLQIESSEIGARFTPYLIDKLNRETDAHWRLWSSDFAYAYVLSESYWDHVCDPDTIRDLVNQQKES